MAKRKVALFMSLVFLIIVGQDKMRAQTVEVQAGFIPKGVFTRLSTGRLVHENLFFGAGAGIQCRDEAIDGNTMSWFVPVYLQVKYLAGSGVARPFLDLKGGLLLNYTSSGTGRFVEPSVGFSYKRLGFSIGYEMMMCRYRTPLIEQAGNGSPYTDPIHIVGYSAFDRGKNSLVLGISYTF